MSDILREAEEKINLLYLPWTYFAEEDQIYSQQDDIEYGEYGSILSKGKDLIAEFHGKHRSKEIIDAINTIPCLVAEIKRLREEIATWQKIAIEERAKYLAASHYIPRIVHPKAVGGAMQIVDDLASTFREHAAKELRPEAAEEEPDDLTVAYMLGDKKADERLQVLKGYVERLEKEYLATWKYFEPVCGEQAAQAALAKIRAGR